LKIDSKTPLCSNERGRVLARGEWIKTTVAGLNLYDPQNRVPQSGPQQLVDGAGAPPDRLLAISGHQKDLKMQKVQLKGQKMHLKMGKR
jgi:hypothetical protein|tara:strand:- start:55 stop:321 length:267 start_codon:yes stop_codon:yes gene_type:complete